LVLPWYFDEQSERSISYSQGSCSSNFVNGLLISLARTDRHGRDRETEALASQIIRLVSPQTNNKSGGENLAKKKARVQMRSPLPLY